MDEVAINSQMVVGRIQLRWEHILYHAILQILHAQCFECRTDLWLLVAAELCLDVVICSEIRWSVIQGTRARSASKKILRIIMLWMTWRRRVSVSLTGPHLSLCKNLYEVYIYHMTRHVPIRQQGLWLSERKQHLTHVIMHHSCVGFPLWHQKHRTACVLLQWK